MTAPRFAPCRCTHPKLLHEQGDLAPQCVARGCSCLAYRPATVNAPSAHMRAVVTSTPVTTSADPAQVPSPSAPTIEQLIKAGKRCNAVFTRRLAERIEKQATDLLGRIAAERDAAERERREQAEKDKVRAEVARLEAELAEAKARLRGRTPPAANTKPIAPTGEHGCTRDGCDRTFTSPQGRAMHERRAHDGFDPNAAKAG